MRIIDLDYPVKVVVVEKGIQLHVDTVHNLQVIINDYIGRLIIVSAIHGSFDYNRETSALVSLKRKKEGVCSYDRNFKSLGGEVFNVAFSPCGATFIYGTKDMKVVQISNSTNESFLTAGYPSGTLKVLSIINSNVCAFTRYKDNSVKLWDITNNALLQTFEDPRSVVNPTLGMVCKIDFNYKENIMVSVSRDCTLKVWDIMTGECLKTFQNTSEIATLTPCGKFALCSYSGDLFLLDLSTGARVQTFVLDTNNKCSKHAIESSAINSQYAILGFYDGSVKIFCLKTGVLLFTVKCHVKLISVICITPDGRYCLTGSWDNTIKLIELATGRVVKTFEGHYDGVSSMAISHDGTMFVSGSFDKSVKQWSLK